MGYTKWLIQKWITKDTFTPILAIIYFSSCLWGAIVVWAIGSVCRYWPFPWAGITFVAMGFLYVFIGFLTWINIADHDHHKLTWAYGLTMILGGFFVLGLAISWWPNL